MPNFLPATKDTCNAFHCGGAALWRSHARTRRFQLATERMRNCTSETRSHDDAPIIAIAPADSVAAIRTIEPAKVPGRKPSRPCDTTVMNRAEMLLAATT